MTVTQPDRRRRVSSTWTDERTDRLIKLFNKGKSASEIAAELRGFGETPDGGRSSVLGKIHRLRADGRLPPLILSGSSSKKLTAAQRQRRKEDKARRKKQVAHPPTRVGLVLAAAPFTAGPELVIPEHERKTLATLDLATDCRWPIGDPLRADFHYCGRTSHPGLPYCEHHCRRAYVLPERYARQKRAETAPRALQGSVLEDA